MGLKDIYVFNPFNIIIKQTDQYIKGKFTPTALDILVYFRILHTIGGLKQRAENPLANKGGYTTGATFFGWRDITKL